MSARSSQLIYVVYFFASTSLGSKLDAPQRLDSTNPRTSFKTARRAGHGRTAIPAVHSHIFINVMEIQARQRKSHAQNTGLLQDQLSIPNFFRTSGCTPEESSSIAIVASTSYASQVVGSTYPGRTPPLRTSLLSYTPTSESPPGTHVPSSRLTVQPISSSKPSSLSGVSRPSRSTTPPRPFPSHRPDVILSQITLLPSLGYVSFLNSQSQSPSPQITPFEIAGSAPGVPQLEGGSELGDLAQVGPSIEAYTSTMTAAVLPHTTIISGVVVTRTLEAEPVDQPEPGSSGVDGPLALRSSTYNE